MKVIGDDELEESIFLFIPLIEEILHHPGMVLKPCK